MTLLAMFTLQRPLNILFYGYSVSNPIHDGEGILSRTSQETKTKQVYGVVNFSRMSKRRPVGTLVSIIEIGIIATHNRGYS